MPIRRAGLRHAVALILAGAVALVVAAPATAHIVPSTTIELDVHDRDITASLTVPATDLTTASGIEVPTDGAPVPEETATAVAAYLADHIAVTSDAGAWAVSVGEVGTAETEQWGTGAFPAVTATATMTAPAGGDTRTFVLDYDAVLHQVVTADVFVILHSDWAAGELESARDLGTIAVDTASGEVEPLPVSLDDASPWRGFLGMVRLGISHIAEGTDHQLFLLTLLIPAPLLAVAGAWARVAPPRRAARTITRITIAFTIGHSLTLALGAIGLPVPQQPVEAAIAVSILVAAVHAVRPIFPGKEAVVAGLFGLVHGMAFSTTLSALDLSGGQLALSLLGFNLGIEIMQLVVLPPLVVLARTRWYRGLRIAAASLTAVAASGWLLDRLGVPNPIAAAADRLVEVAIWVVLALWLAAAAAWLTRDRSRGAMPIPVAVPD